MKTHNFHLVNNDTDSITFCKPNGDKFSEEEQESLLEELNSLYPPEINWEHDGYYKKIIVLKAKNYVLWDGEEVKYKGSALKSSTLELGFQEYLKETLDCFLQDRPQDVLLIYKKYLKELCNIQDIKRWASKKTLTETMYKSERKNERQVLEAIKGKEYTKGDKVWVYFDENDVMKTVEDFVPGCYSKKRFYEKLYKCALRFESIMDASVFKNYALKKNLKTLEQDLGIQI